MGPLWPRFHYSRAKDIRAANATDVVDSNKQFESPWKGMKMNWNRQRCVVNGYIYMQQQQPPLPR